MKQFYRILIGILFLGGVVQAQNIFLTSPDGGENWKSDAFQNVT